MEAACAEAVSGEAVVVEAAPFEVAFVEATFEIVDWKGVKEVAVLKRVALRTHCSVCHMREMGNSIHCL